MRGAGLWMYASIMGGCTGKAESRYGTGPEIFSEETAHIGDSWIFSSERINRIDLEVGEDAMEILLSERRFSYPRNKVRVEASMDGSDIGEVGLRIRGGLGSFQRFGDKPKLEIDFNEFTGDRFHGLESLSLNNFAQGCAGIQEAVAFAAYGLMGVPTSRTGYAQLFVNGEDYGIYLVVETQDDRWLERTFEDGGGNFYDGKYHLVGFTPYIVDFGKDKDHWFDLEEGEDIGFEDIAKVSEGVLQAQRTGQIDGDFWQLVDWHEVAAVLRTEQWLGNDDSFGMGPNNYRVYFEPGAPMKVTPWDTDSALGGWMSTSQGETAQVSFDPSAWEEPGSALAQVCLADPHCRSYWEDLEPIAAEMLADGRLLELGEALDELVLEGLVGDPRSHCSAEDIKDAHAAILDYLLTQEIAPVPVEPVEGEEQGCSTASPPRGGLWMVMCLLALACRRRR